MNYECKNPFDEETKKWQAATAASSKSNVVMFFVDVWERYAIFVVEKIIYPLRGAGVLKKQWYQIERKLEGYRLHCRRQRKT